MQRVNPRDKDPDRYQRVKEAQKELENEYRNCMTIARLCPYCGHRVEILYKGSHGASHVKCSSCGEEVLFPPVFFRWAV